MIKFVSQRRVFLFINLLLAATANFW
jgi:hypothetical protein